MSQVNHSPESWNRAKEILATALELRPEHRKSFVAELDIDTVLRGEIEELLDLTADCNEFLTIPAVEISTDFFKEVSDGNRSVHQPLGPYEIVGELGTGGMGSVFLGERSDGKFKQKVAIKMLRREFDTASIRRNFEREKEILAGLSHPSIAGLLDAGQTDDGFPYLVMEYVDGVPVDKYCFENDLSLNERLKLFNRICDAVSFAHRKLVVHMDLKPSNILVTGEKVPKLLDFGISKILDDDNRNTPTTLHRALTPEYASPEQINGDGISTATDVYSLGIVLYKMLTGTLPFSRKGNGSNGLFQAITEDDAPAPSLLAARHENTLKSVERSEQAIESVPRSCVSASHLRGDLDNIILKAIQKDPDDRYGSVEQLSADIWRYIDGKPVEARSATLGYRLRKFYTRNRVSVAAGILIITTLIAGVAVSAWQTKVARANAAVAVAESENAKAEQQKAEKISRFMMRFVRYANPNWYAEGHRFAGDTRVVEALDDMASKIDIELAEQRDVLAELHHHFGDAYMSRKDPARIEQARNHFRRAFELRRAHYGDWHELLAKDMAYLYWSQTPPRSEEGVRLLSNAITMMRSTNPMNLNLPYMLEDYFHHLYNPRFENVHDLYLRNVPQPAPDDKYLAAEQLYDEMMGLLRNHFEEESVQIITQKCEGIMLKLKAGRPAEAEELYNACSAANERFMSAGDPKAKWQEILETYEKAVR